MKSGIGLKIGVVCVLIVSGLSSFSLGRAADLASLSRITDYQTFTIDSYDPSISDDGRYVVYTSYPAGYEMVILFDRQTSTPTQIASGHTPVISGDGRFIAFGSSATDLVPNDTNGQDDIFVYHRQGATIERVSITSAGAQAVGGGSFFPSISFDGRYVAFESWADNLGGSGIIDVFVRDRVGLLTHLVSQNSVGTPNYFYARSASISGDGRFVVFKADATNLVSNDHNNVSDIFLRNIQSGLTTRISESWLGGDSNGASGTPVISEDGRFIAYSSLASDLVNGDTNSLRDVFLFDRYTGITSLVSLSPAGVQGNADSGCNDSSFVLRCLGISAHGRYVSFPSEATNFFSGYNTFNTYQNVYLRDRQESDTLLISREYYSSTWGENGDDDSGPSVVSGSGRYVAFQSRAWLMGVEGPGNEDIFVYDQGDDAGDFVRIMLPLVPR